MHGWAIQQFFQPMFHGYIPNETVVLRNDRIQLHQIWAIPAIPKFFQISDILVRFETTAIVENRVNLMSVNFSCLMIQYLMYIWWGRSAVMGDSNLEVRWKSTETTVVKCKTFRLSSGGLTTDWKEQPGRNLTCYYQRWSSDLCKTYLLLVWSMRYLIGELLYTNTLSEPRERAVDKPKQRPKRNQVSGDVGHQWDGVGSSCRCSLDKIHLRAVAQQWTPSFYRAAWNATRS